MKPISKFLEYYDFYEVSDSMNFSDDFSSYLFNYLEVSNGSYNIIDLAEMLNNDDDIKEEFKIMLEKLIKEFNCTTICLYIYW